MHDYIFEIHVFINNSMSLLTAKKGVKIHT